MTTNTGNIRAGTATPHDGTNAFTAFDARHVKEARRGECSPDDERGGSITHRQALKCSDGIQPAPREQCAG